MSEGSAPEKGPGSDGEGSAHSAQTRPLAVGMAMAALVIGTVLAVYILYTPGRSTTAPPTTLAAAGAPTPISPALAEQGARLVTLSCAGCHDTTQRLIGPSWSEIARRYRGNGDMAAAAGRLKNAVLHPASGWGGGEPGPTMHLTEAERDALAAYILLQNRSSDSTAAQGDHL